MSKKNIGGLEFKIHENLGKKNLIPPDNIKVLGTLIGELNKEYGKQLRDQLKNGIFFSNDAIKITLVTQDKIKKAVAFWQHHSDEEICSIMVHLVVPDLDWEAFLPHDVLIELVDVIERLMTESTLTPPPWLFRKKSLAPYPCRKGEYKGKEEQMIRNLEYQLLNERIEVDALLSNNICQENDFLGVLEQYGLLSEEYMEVKIDFLNRWGASCLSTFYQKWIQWRKLYEYEAHETLDILAKNIFNELSKTTSKQERDTIYKLRVKLLHLLNEQGYLEKLSRNNGRLLLMKETASLIDLNRYLKAIGFLWQYTESKERKLVIGDKKIEDILFFPITLEWFLLQKPAKGYTPFGWLALCEKELYKEVINQPEQLFVKINGKTTILYITDVDGTIPKLTNYLVKDN